ncbi:MAG: hypothetical protein ABW039_00970 [Sphingobium sp.]
MKKLSSGALVATLLALGVPSLAASPADQGVIAMSDGFRAGVVSARAALTAGQWASASAQIAALMPANDFEAYTASGLRFELAVVQRDVRAQRVAVNAMLKTASVPASDAPRLHFLAAYFAYVLGDYDDTLRQLGQAKALGYDATDATLLTADTYLRKNKPKDARPFVANALARQRAAGQAIAPAWYDRAISLAYLSGDWKELGALYRERLSLYPSTGDWRSALVNSLAAPGLDTQGQLDLYRLQAANGAMASERDYLAYSALAEKAGYSAEAKAVIEAGRAAGKLTPTQTTSSQLLKTVTPKATKEIAALPAAGKKADAARGGGAAMAVADSHFSLGQFAQAAAYYRMALDKGGIDTDRAHSRLGVALARSGDLPGARAELDQAGGNWQGVAGFWTVWVDQQSGKAQARAGDAPAAS